MSRRRSVDRCSLHTTPLVLGVVAIVASACGAVSSGHEGNDSGGPSTLPDAGADRRAPTRGDAGMAKVDAATHDARPRGDAETAADASDGQSDGSDEHQDAGAPPEEASSVYPAFAPNMPQVVSNGGAVLTSPQIVTVTWPNEASVSEYESFGDLVGTGAYWAATTSEYGVGPATSGPSNHVHITDLPLATMSTTDVDNYIIDHATNFATSGWPAPNENVIYLLYLSAQTDLIAGTSDLCAEAGGYHDSLTVNGVDTVYAIIPHCQALGGGETAAASHELIEASTDPHPEDLPGFLGFDSDHLAWDVWQLFQSEVGDACEFYSDAFSTLPFGGDAGMQMYSVQRTWSNAAASAGHNPCQPAAAVPYYNLAPIGLETISLNLSGTPETGAVQTLGYHVRVGETKTFTVGFYSDAPTGGAWNISASESPAYGPPTSYLSIALDLNEGQNGNLAHVTVTVNSVNPSMNGELLSLKSQLGSDAPRYLPILIGSE